MPRDVNGNYTLPSGVNPVVSGTGITSNWANTTLDDIASALTDSLDREGRGGMNAALPFASGTEALPGMTWSEQTNAGFYLFTPGDMRASVGAQDIMRWQGGLTYTWDSVDEVWRQVLTTGGPGGLPEPTVGGSMLRYNTTNDEWEDTQGIRVDLNGDVVIGGGNAYSASYDVTVNGGLAVTGGGFIDGGVLLGATTAQSFLSQGAAQFNGSLNWPGYIFEPTGLDLIILTSGVQPFRVLSCDAELKENIRDLDYGVEQVRAGPRARRFDTKDGSTRGAVGFIAQEMRQVIPEAFIDVEERYDEEGNKIGEAGIGMSSLPILATLWNTVQDLAQEVEDLRNAQ